MLRWGVYILGALILIGGLATCAVYRRDIRAAQAQLRMACRVISTPCGPIEYQDIHAPP